MEKFHKVIPSGQILPTGRLWRKHQISNVFYLRYMPRLSEIIKLKMIPLFWNLEFGIWNLEFVICDL